MELLQHIKISHKIEPERISFSGAKPIADLSVSVELWVKEPGTVIASVELENEDNNEVIVLGTINGLPVGWPNNCHLPISEIFDEDMTADQLLTDTLTAVLSPRLGLNINVEPKSVQFALSYSGKEFVRGQASELTVKSFFQQ